MDPEEAYQDCLRDLCSCNLATEDCLCPVSGCAVDLVGDGSGQWSVCGVGAGDFLLMVIMGTVTDSIADHCITHFESLGVAFGSSLDFDYCWFKTEVLCKPWS